MKSVFNSLVSVCACRLSAAVRLWLASCAAVLIVAACSSSQGTGPVPPDRAFVEAPKKKKKPLDPELAKQYINHVRQTIGERQLYPQEAVALNLQGSGVIRLTIGDTGWVRGIAIKESTGFDVLDYAMIVSATRVERFDPLPAEFDREELTISLPISYIKPAE